MTTIAGVLLAAGLSRRFGDADKLALDYGGTALGTHAAARMAALPLTVRIAVIGPDADEIDGFATVRNLSPESGQARSLALGIAAADAAGVDAVLVMLADMPLVEPAHLAALLSHYSGKDTRVASTAGDHPQPPALFGRGWFDRLTALTGDAGARELMGGAVLVRASAASLADIDTPEDIARLPPVPPSY